MANVWIKKRGLRLWKLDNDHTENHPILRCFTYNHLRKWYTVFLITNSRSSKHPKEDKLQDLKPFDLYNSPTRFPSEITNARTHEVSL